MHPHYLHVLHSNGETRFSLICEKLIFRKRNGVVTYFNFFKRENKIKRKTLYDSLFEKYMFVKTESELEN